MKQNMDWFLNYWDDVIRRWFDEEVESKQQLFLNEQWLNLNSRHMPEPYWGDPENCSIVIANYNPGGGADRDRHTYRDCAYCHDSFINEVKKNGYQNIAKYFPIIDKPTNSYNPLKEGICWMKEYGGRKWWLSKNAWLNDNIIGALPNDKKPNHDKPFAIEFCGWHSVSWPPNACITLYKKNGFSPYVHQYFIKPLVEAVHNSDTRLGVCVGAQFFHLFEEMAKCGTSCIQRIDTTNPLNKNKLNIHLFRINGENILVLWGQRRNRYPKGISATLSAFLKNHKIMT